MLLKCRSLSSVHLCGLPTKNVPLYLCFDIAFPPKMDYTAVCRLCIVRCNNGSQLGVTGHTLSSQGTSANVWRRFSLEHSGGLLPSSGERSEGLLNMQKYRRQSSPPPTILPTSNNQLAHNIHWGWETVKECYKKYLCAICYTPDYVFSNSPSYFYWQQSRDIFVPISHIWKLWFQWGSALSNVPWHSE